MSEGEKDMFDGLAFLFVMLAIMGCESSFTFSVMCLFFVGVIILIKEIVHGEN